MKTHIVGKPFYLGESLRAHIEEALKRVLSKSFDHAITYHVTVEKNHDLIHTAIEIHVGQGIVVFADENNEDSYTSVDRAIHKIENNLRRYKERLKAHHTNHDLSKEEKGMQYILHSSYRNLEGSDETHEDHKQPSVIAETTAYVPTISVSEAVMRLDLSGNHALLFRNKSHGELNMVYLRKDGNIGWIDPKGNKGH